MVYFFLVTSICFSIRLYRRRDLVPYNFIGQTLSFKLITTNLKFLISNPKLILSICLIVTASLQAQTEKQTLSNTSLLQKKDSAIVANKPKPSAQLKDTTTLKDTIAAKPKHDPRIATRRSLIFPGLGQIYNREYWKLPIVYGALAIPTYAFFFNDGYYKELKFAYNARYKAALSVVAGRDSTDYYTLETKYQKADVAAIQSVRNASRRNRDYSILWFFIVWGVNVADATVFGHLKNFDVSNDLSMHIQPTFNPTTNGPGVSLVVNFKTPEHKLSSILK